MTRTGPVKRTHGFRGPTFFALLLVRAVPTVAVSLLAGLRADVGGAQQLTIDGWFGARHGSARG
jgi:hypothetical protein